MGKRATNHSFNKRQKERKRKEKAEKKQQRRLMKKQAPTDDASPVADEGSNESPVALTFVEGDVPTQQPASPPEDE